MYIGYDTKITAEQIATAERAAAEAGANYVKKHGIACGGDWCAMLYSSVPAEDRVLLEGFIRDYFDARGLDHDSGGIGTLYAMQQFINLRYGRVTE